ncbi:MAG: hypothetical protein C5B50_12615 [Verrucomicrobia bacterium]|nr:MAG: hypothetical protein C5B50_12615 [Verrucomicrobiota bacterium]
MTPGPPPRAWLDSTGGERKVLEDNCVLGRSAECQLVLKDPRISRRHAMIHRQGGEEFWLVDLGSANGSRVNGRRVVQPCRLNDGDEIELGGITFKFRQPTLSPAARGGDDATVATLFEIKTFDCWLLVADMVGSTQLLQKTDEGKAASVTGQWLARCNLIVETHRGAINKYLGDGFLAYWSQKAGMEQEVAGALQAFKKLREGSDPLFRVALHYGVTVAGGAPSRGEESLAGKDVNFVFRMEDLASNLGTGLLLSQAATQRLGELISAEPCGNHSLAGFEGSFPFFSF